MSFLLRHIKKMDWIMITSAFLLAVAGLVFLYGYSVNRGDFSNFHKQIFFLVLGVFLLFLFSFIDWRVFKQDSYLILVIYLICLISLVLLLFLAPEIRGVRKWYKVGEFSIDPIEFTKIALILLLAKYFSTRHVEMYQFKHIFLSGIYVLLPIIFIFLQPDLGSILVLLSLWLGILLLSGIRLRHFLIICLCGILLLAAGWQFFLKDYQKERIASFIFPQTADSLRIGWNQLQSEIAIGNGGFWGKGLGRGTQVQYGFLPESQTDFVFAAVAEETGFFGVLILFALLFILIWRVISVAYSSSSNFPRLFALGFCIVLVSQIIINIGMNVGILPIIGIPLPLVSYGGGNLVLTFVAIGMLQNMRCR